MLSGPPPLTSLRVGQHPGRVGGVDRQRRGVGAVHVPRGGAGRDGGGVEVQRVEVDFLGRKGSEGGSGDVYKSGVRGERNIRDGRIEETREG